MVRNQTFKIWAGVLLFAAIALTAIFWMFSIGGDPVYVSMADYYQDIYGEIRMSGLSEYAIYNYNELYRYAHTVAIVTPCEELTAENSYGIYLLHNKYYDFRSARTVRTFQVETYFKNEKSYGDTIEISELCVRLEDGSVVIQEDCFPMQVGNFYLVFLTDGPYRYPVTMSADNGRYDLTHLSLNDYKTVLIDALIQLDLLDRSCAADVSAHLGGIAGYNGLRYVERNQFGDQAIDWNVFSIYTKYTDKNYRLTVHCADTEEGRLFQIDDNIYTGK